MVSRSLPRVMIAAPGSGHGKTTVATGLMSALRADGLEVAGFKVGPDYIDPGYHALATGRPGRNLDPYLCPPDRLAPLLLHGAEVPTAADVAVVEGVMGLFDGRIGADGFASTAHVATVLSIPVILVLDISSMSRTAAAVVQGLHTFESAVRLSGVILNKAGSVRHSEEVARALEATGLEVLGVLPRDAGIEVPSRHLGLVPAAERAEAVEAVGRLGQRVADHVSLAAVLSIASQAAALAGEPWSAEAAVQPPSALRPVVAVAAGRAFTFRYAETDELLRAAGCEPVVFDPLLDTALPPGTAGIYLGGGFPEVHAAELSANTALRDAVGDAVRAGMPTVAECAGLLYLCRSVDGVPMVGAIQTTAEMTGRLTLGYRTAVTDHDHLLAPAGSRVTGHEFHRTVTSRAPGQQPGWLLDGVPDGVASRTLHASYLHVHWAGHPRLAQSFADAVHAFAAAQPPDHDLRHHGDLDAADGLVDLAVNVRLAAPPEWLADVINDCTSDLAAYPRADAAVEAIARAHGVSPDQVLPTAGGAEAFTLLSRALRPGRAVVVHPQFTEPEVALRAAGHSVLRLVLQAEQGFRLEPEQVTDDCDVVMIGNPTNPTGVLHPRAALRRLVRPGRVVCVDEAFMDTVPGEPESMIMSSHLDGVVVVRSLTKTWGLAGLRAGYAVGDANLIARMRAQQPPWSVSTPALKVIEVCLTPEARRIAALAAEEYASARSVLVRELTGLGLAVNDTSAAPFVLVDARGWPNGREPGSLRQALRERGYAVRRGETFPGLNADWVRIAVRDVETTNALVTALRMIKETW